MTDTAKRAEEALREAHTTCGCGCSCSPRRACEDCADHHRLIEESVALARLDQVESLVAEALRHSGVVPIMTVLGEERDRLHALVEEAKDA